MDVDPPPRDPVSDEQQAANRTAQASVRTPTRALTPLWRAGLILLGAGFAVWLMADTGLVELRYFTQAKRAQVVELCQARAQTEYGPIERWTNGGDVSRVNKSDFDADKFYWLDEAQRISGSQDANRFWISCDVKEGEIIDFKVFEGN